MRMNHINLATSDVPASRAFLETYFGLRCLTSPNAETIVAMVDENECLVVLSNFKKTDEVVYPNGFHIGFMQPSREAVDAMHDRLSGDGIEVGPRKDFHGAWTFYMKAPGGFTVEVGHQYEAIAAQAA